MPLPDMLSSTFGVVLVAGFGVEVVFGLAVVVVVVLVVVAGLLVVATVAALVLVVVFGDLLPLDAAPISPSTTNTMITVRILCRANQFLSLVLWSDMGQLLYPLVITIGLPPYIKSDNPF